MHGISLGTAKLQYFNYNLSFVITYFLKTTVKLVLNVALPLLLGLAIMWWMYREFDFRQLLHTLRYDTAWGWMLLSLVFGVLAPVLRGLRWRQTLEPLGENPRRSTCIHAVFISYAASLVVPRIGEVTRCGILNRYDGTSFSKSIGTVITERIIDALLLLTIVVVVILSQLGIFYKFFEETGVGIGTTLQSFTPMGWFVTILCLIVTVVFLFILLKRFKFSPNIRKFFSEIRTGIFSLRDVRNKTLFAAYTIGIWLCYFLHFYIAFYCFQSTQVLGLDIGLVTFIVCSIAVIVPTPNGMGPWHFAVKTILVLYGVETTGAETFVLVVHTVHTALIPILAVYVMMCLKRRPLDLR